MVQRGTQAEDVRIGPKTRFFAVLLWGRVAWCHETRMPLGKVPLERAGGSEINEDDPPLRRQHDISRLDIPVQKVLGMHGLQGLAQRLRQTLDFIRRYPAFLLDARFQRPALQILHHDIGRAVLLERVVNLHDAWSAQAEQQLRFLQQALAFAYERLLLLRGNGDRGTYSLRVGRNVFLDGHGVPEIPVRALVRNAEAPFAQHASDSEFALLQSVACRQIARQRPWTAGRAAAGTRILARYQRGLADGAGTVNHVKRSPVWTRCSCIMSR